ncbi:hypothetical protein MYIN104542_28295 [Mycobacterium intermedium]
MSRRRDDVVRATSQTLPLGADKPAEHKKLCWGRVVVDHQCPAEPVTQPTRYAVGSRSIRVSTSSSALVCHLSMSR